MLRCKGSLHLAEAILKGCPRSLGIPILGNVGMGLISVKPKEEHALLSSVVFKNFEHSGYPKDPGMKGFPRLGNSLRPGYVNVPETEGTSRLGNFENSGFPTGAEMEGTPRPMDSVRGLGNSGFLKDPGMKGFPRLGNSLRPGYLNVPEMEGSSKLGNFEKSGNPTGAEMEGTPRPMDYVRGLLEDEASSKLDRPQFSRYGAHFNKYNMEQNADVVHIKILRNNTFVTLTDAKGNKKAGSNVSVSAGGLPDRAGKNSRLAAEASAEHVGRKARDIGVKSVVVKVNGLTFFKKKRQAIMSFREGYNQSRGNQNPVVYIEDTTRRPHNGCRLKKKRRI